MTTATVGLLNHNAERVTVTANWSDPGLQARQPTRDLWQQKDRGASDGSFATEVPAHGAVLVKIGRAKPMT